ncbi:MAG: D-alanyl-D-alanine carboxypeptidase [Oscillospiraceae bacterium]|nr:D-alanyl-D-alanine carboxypeptidase [Oscillospiraceae bacterium]
MKRLGWILVVLSLLMGLLPFSAKAADLEVEAKSALLMDVATGTVLFEQNSHEALAPASVTKVMTMLLIMEAIDSSKIGWGDSVTASEAAAAKGGSQVFLKVGESMTVEDMVKSIAVSSANDCACAMAEHLAGSEAAFVENMNARAKELGMEDTNFVNCTGLDDAEDASAHRTSAHDIALMSRELLKNHPDITKFTTIWMDTIRNGEFGLSNTNKMVRFYNGCTGLKTGFTRGAGYCLSASAEREGLQLIAVVMGCETSQKRFAACKSMLDYGFANFALIEPELPEVSSVSVKLGIADSVNAVPASDGKMLIDKSQKASVSTEVQLEEEVTAPVSKGQRLGTMTVKAGDRILAEIPMVAEAGVEKLTWGQMYLRLLKKICMK